MRTFIIILVVIIAIVLVVFLTGRQEGEEPVVEAAAVNLNSSEELGDYLIGADSMTLYTKQGDSADVSTCYGVCAENWPPLSVDGEATLGENLTGTLSSLDRTDGTSQVTYNDMPLYSWAGDQTPGDTTGHGFNNVWSVATP